MDHTLIPPPDAATAADLSSPASRSAAPPQRHADDTAARRIGAPVLGVFIDAADWSEALATTARWAAGRESRYVCFCNAHSVVTLAGTSPEVIDEADLALPDGMPVAWMLRRHGFAEQARINGPDFMWKYCAAAERRGEAVYFYGSTPETLAALAGRLALAFPRLKIAGMYSPPFVALSAEEDAAVVAHINDSGAAAVFVGLGCPKQERWMRAHRGAIRAVMFGVGAAFDYHAGTLRRAPAWMQRRGLEWLYRLVTEPRRLWRRYLVTNALFLAGACRQLAERR